MPSKLVDLMEYLDLNLSLLRCDVVICCSEFAKVGL